MINEYFVEPTLIYKWATDHKDTAFFLNQFGLGYPRLISSFPKAKGSRLRSLIISAMPEDLTDIAQRRVEEFAATLADEALPRSIPQDIPEDWNSAARKMCAENPPDVVISSQVNEEVDHWITEEAAYQKGSCFHHRAQADPPRTAEGFTDVVRNMLRYSRQILLVDPYLSKRAGLETVISFLASTQDRRLVGSPVVFQLIYDGEAGASADFVEEQLEPVVRGCNIILNTIPVKEKAGGEKLHNRYLLTEFGGVSFGVGTDAGEDYHSDDLVLLDRELYFRRWGQYWNAAEFDRA